MLESEKSKVESSKTELDNLAADYQKELVIMKKEQDSLVGNHVKLEEEVDNLRQIANIFIKSAKYFHNFQV